MVKTENNLHQRLLTARLPALPQVLLRFLELSRREDAGLDDIGRLIAQDPAMASKVLTLTSSASRYQNQSPKDLLQCLILIGLDNTKTALMAESIHQVFDSFVAGRTVDLGPFWKHSLSTAILAGRLAKATGYARREEAYLAGLLHDVGQLALVTTLPERYFNVFSESYDDSWLTNWESLSLGLTHAEAGAWLAGRWQLDSYLADALLYHHEPVERIVSAHPLVRITWLAHALSRDPEMDTVLFGLDAEARLRIQDGISEEVDKAARFLGIDLARKNAGATARAQLAETLRPMALAGVQQAVSPPPERELLPRLQAIMTAAQSLYGLGYGLLFEPKDGSLRGRVAWSHLSRLEELVVPVGPDGGCIGRASGSGRLATTWDVDHPALILDDQLCRALGSEGILCLPLTTGSPAEVLVFGLDKDKAQALQTWPLLLERFAREAAAALDIGEKTVPGEAGLPQDHLRRIVHEANNPLSIIKNYLHILGERFEGQEAAADIGLLNSEIDRVSRILNGLTVPVAISEKPAGREIGLNATIRELIAFCRDTGFIPAGIQIDWALAENLPAVRVNPDILKQILLNLVKNAVEVLGNHGRIGIESAGPVFQDGKSHVLMRVFDDGPGIPAEIRERLFQPVATRKGGEHAGLGLAIVGELVARLQGRITCNSSETGTVFEISLPLAGPAGEAA
jgi:HD-like signal output (HDOD) protein/nitrogen-specific signal transduction histidine kinase